MKYYIFSLNRICPIGAHLDHLHGLVTGFALNHDIDLWFDITDGKLPL
ncbi:Uncharacterised protein [Bacteroides thetaiotaomicron]|nr:Uncharacterised protein [Bacteroides thetaiotaomicron]